MVHRDGSSHCHLGLRRSSTSLLMLGLDWNAFNEILVLGFHGLLCGRSLCCSLQYLEPRAKNFSILAFGGRGLLHIWQWGITDSRFLLRCFCVSGSSPRQRLIAFICSPHEQPLKISGAQRCLAYWFQNQCSMLFCSTWPRSQTSRTRSSVSPWHYEEEAFDHRRLIARRCSDTCESLNGWQPITSSSTPSARRIPSRSKYSLLHVRALETMDQGAWRKASGSPGYTAISSSGAASLHSFLTNSHCC